MTDKQIEALKNLNLTSEDIPTENNRAIGGKSKYKKKVKSSKKDKHHKIDKKVNIRSRLDHDYLFNAFINSNNNLNNLIILGVDLAQNTGLAWYSQKDDKYFVKSIRTREMMLFYDEIEHYNYIEIRMREFLLSLQEDYPNSPILIGIEYYSMFGTKIVQTAQLGGIIRSLFHKEKLFYIDIGISDHKKMSSGKGDADKHETTVGVTKLIASRLCSLYGENALEDRLESTHNDDESDALSICEATRVKLKSYIK